MKISAPFLLVLISFFSSGQSKQGPGIAWDKNTHDFGDIVQGEKVEHTFKFTNTGSEPLVITNVEVTCGCTIPKGWPRDPINPGGKGEITVQFDSTHKIGRQNKVATVISNAPAGNSQITFSVNVLEKKKP
ncbi:MAG TPA: DUF1573 domain-containing protein [Cyclobacteriaceae bacterium]|jgi:hypothetical protein|nr:DUF1573 domain-containing protein [Cyclobacteriaceae bacterium]